ncbi:CoA transferase [Pelagerythrobacter marensis]|uniref:CoA transferase n=1 Tax=Pelagerythrobacter marensis TaxID=543877 RepID=A0ABZ2D6A3_9SPHN
MSQPLSGVVVADFSHVMAGPYASHLMRLMGATVIKIEPKHGDQFRNYGGDGRYDGMAPAFIAANAGKKSIALDLKNTEDLEIARSIVAKSEVLLENFRPGVIGRLGLGYETVKQLRPDIVFCSVSGYGQTGPYRDWPAIDNIVQATTGMMMLSGDESMPPVRVGFPIVDTLTGQSAALAITAALLRKRETGEGAHIDVSMFDASLAFMTSTLTPFLVTGNVMRRMGNTGYSGLPTASLFTARDGRQISLGVVQDNQFASLAKHLDRTDWLADARFATAAARRENFDLMQIELAGEIAKRDAADWERSMSEAGIPCGMVRRVEEAAELAGEAALLDLETPDEFPGKMRVPNVGFEISNGSPGTREAPPTLDGNRDEILEWLSRD